MKILINCDNFKIISKTFTTFSLKISGFAFQILYDIWIKLNRKRIQRSPASSISWFIFRWLKTIDKPATWVGRAIPTANDSKGSVSRDGLWAATQSWSWSKMAVGCLWCRCSYLLLLNPVSLSKLKHKERLFRPFPALTVLDFMNFLFMILPQINNEKKNSSKRHYIFESKN